MFVESLGAALSDPVRLEVPTGRSWVVGLRRDDEGLYLGDGWAAFLEECGIQLGYIILFRCEGDSRFSVGVFDITTCEINEIEHLGWQDVRAKIGSGTPGKGQVVKIEESEYKESTGEGAKVGRKKPRQCSDTPSKKSKAGALRGMEIQALVPDRSLMEARQETLSNRKCGVKGRIVPIDVSGCSVVEAQPEASTSELLQALNGGTDVIDFTCCCLSETRQHSSGMESCRLRKPAEFRGPIAADEKFEAFLRAASFLCENMVCVVIIRCLGCLHIPKKFLMACFPGRKEFGDITCVSERKSWTLGINKSQCPRFRRGWTGFVADNDLRIGDASVFELMERAEDKFRVVIFHDKRVASSVEKPPCRQRQRFEVSSEVDEVNEERPRFTIVITKTSTRHSVHVPTTFAKSHLPTIQAAENVKASLEYKGLSWPVALYSRICCGSAYTMIKGWQKFRKGNGFKLGEELVLELVDKNDLVFRVAVSNDAEGLDCCDC